MLREAEVVLAQEMEVDEICCKLWLSELSHYRWLREYGGLKTNPSKQMKN